MKLNLHGELPSGWNDPHGVFRCEPGGTTLAPDDPSAQVDGLVAALATADERLTALLEKVRSGETDPRVHADLASAAEESSRLASELNTAQREAEESAQRRAQEDTKARRQRLETVLEKAGEHKRLFAEMYRATCLALGDFCREMDEATQLANSLATIAGVAPLDKNRIADLKKDLDPMRTFVGLQPTKHYGWNISFSVVPLHVLGKE